MREHENQIRPARSISESLMSACEHADRIANLLALIHSDLTGSEATDGTEAVYPGTALTVVASALEQRLEFIASRLPLLRQVIVTPDVQDLAVGVMGGAKYDPRRVRSTTAGYE